MMDLGTLISLTPLDEETRKQMLSQVGTFTEDEKYEVSRICWRAIAQMRDLQYIQATDKLLEEIKEGKRKYNKNDFTQVQAQLVFNFKQRKEQAIDQSQLETVRSQLQPYLQKKNPPSYPLSISSDRTDN